MLQGVVSNLLCFLAYPDMFRHPNAILRGFLVPIKLLQFWSVFRVYAGYCSLGVAICCGMLPSLYRGLGSCGDCSLMSSRDWCNCCMNKFFHIFMRAPLWHVRYICK